MIAPFNENTVIFSPEESPDKCIFPFDTVTLKELFIDSRSSFIHIFRFFSETSGFVDGLDAIFVVVFTCCIGIRCFGSKSDYFIIAKYYVTDGIRYGFPTKHIF